METLRLSVSLTAKIQPMGKLKMDARFQDYLGERICSRYPKAKVSKQPDSLIVSIRPSSDSEFEEVAAFLRDVVSNVKQFGKFSKFLDEIVAERPELKDHPQFGSILSAYDNFVRVLETAEGMSTRAALNNTPTPPKAHGAEPRKEKLPRQEFREQSIHRIDVGLEGKPKSPEVPRAYDTIAEKDEPEPGSVF